MNIVRAGHMYLGVPSADQSVDDRDCNEAVVVHADNAHNAVNVVWHDHDGHGPYIGTAVPVDAGTHPEQNTFHLSGDCPWKR